MKILLIGVGNLRYMPYMNLYLNALHDTDDVIDLIYWDRDGEKDIEVPLRINKIYKFKYVEDNSSFIKKIPGFFRFRKFSIKVLRHEIYDKIIILYSVAGVLINDYLIKHYSGKYIFDFRDLSHENLKIYRRIIDKLVCNSYLTFVSSEGFKKYLPNSNKIFNVHNISMDIFENRHLEILKKKNIALIKIAYWGLIRHKECNINLINELKNNQLFELHYYGREQKCALELKKYCCTNNVKNVYFHGAYFPKQRYEFANDIDIIHNIYNNDFRMKYAHTNKYYDGVFLRIPQLCMKDSFMGKLVEEKKVGLSLQMNGQIVEDIINYYNKLDLNEFNTFCQEEEDRIMREQRICSNKIIEFVKK